MKKGGAGDQNSPQASAGQGQVQMKEDGIVKEDGIGGGTYPQASAGQTGSGRWAGGRGSEGQSGAANDDEPRGERMSGDEATR